MWHEKMLIWEKVRLFRACHRKSIGVPAAREGGLVLRGWNFKFPLGPDTTLATRFGKRAPAKEVMTGRVVHTAWRGQSTR
jgi:hypothetical protein